MAMLVTYAVQHDDTKKLSKLDLGGSPQVCVDKWFWRRAISQKYRDGQSAMSKVDIVSLCELISASTVPDDKMFKEHTDFASVVTPGDLEKCSSKTSALHKCVMALLRKNGAKDFHKTGTLNGDIDIHHVFPRKHMYPTDASLPQADSDLIVKVESVVNQTPVYGPTNKQMSDKPPKEYLEDLVGNDQLKWAYVEGELLRHHIVMDHLRQDPSTKSDSFRKFYAYRQSAILEMLRKAYE